MLKIVKTALKALLAAISIFANTGLLATDFTWKTVPGNNQLFSSANWIPAGVPGAVNPNDRAFFGQTTITSLLFGGNFNPALVNFNADNQVTDILVNGGNDWQMTVTGFTNLSPSTVSIDVTDSSILAFFNSSSAMTSPNSVSPMVYNVSNSSVIDFLNSSTAGGVSLTNGPIFNVDNSFLSFFNSSTGGFAQIHLTNNGFFSTNHNLSITSISSDASSTVSLGGALTVNQTTPQTIAGIIQDGFFPGSLVDNGPGVLTLSGPNTYTNGTTINPGATIQVSASNNLGTGTVNMNGGKLQFTASTTLANPIALTTTSNVIDTQANTDTLSGNITGSGGFTKQGSGTLILTGNNNYLGGTTIAAGTIKGTTNSIVGNYTNNSQLTFDQNFAGSYINTIAGSGHVTITGGGSVTFTGPNSYTGGTTIDVGSTLVGSASTIPGDVVDNGNLTLNQLSDGTFNGVISGTGSLTVNEVGSATLTLTGANTYSGGTTVVNGRLKGTTTSLQGNINLVNPSAFVDFDQNTPGTYAGILSGSGGVNINQDGGNGIITFTGINTYTGNTTLYGGTLSVSSDANLGAPSSNVVFNGGTLQFTSSLTSARNMILNTNGTIDTQANTDTLTGIISGPGSLTKIGSGTLILTAANSYTGGTNIFGGTLQGTSTSIQGNVVDNGSLVFDQNFDGAMAGIISGTGSVTKLGTGKLILTGANTYSGGTIVSAGTLQGNTTSLQGAITNNATLIFDQTTDGTFNGSLAGTGTTIKQGAGTLTLVNNSAGFTGTTLVNQGILALNTILGGNMTVQQSGTLIGSGKLLGNLLINSNGTISPGNNGIGTLSVGGTYIQNSGTTYLVDINSSGNSDLIAVSGTAQLNGGDVKVNSLDGSFSLTHNYDILHADGGVTGAFDSVTSNTTLQPLLIYTPNDVFLSFGEAFVGITQNQNQTQVAGQLINISTPTPAQAALLHELASLTIPEMLAALTSLSGQQFTNLFILAEESSERFVKLLYDPLRRVNNLDPRCLECCSFQDAEIWFEGGRSHTTFHPDSVVKGMTINSNELATGVQFSGLLDTMTLGFAVYYERDQAHFNEGGSDKAHTFLGGIYGLYRYCDHYLLADLVVGSSNHTIVRPIVVGDLNFVAHSKPTIVQGMGYLEWGRNCWFESCNPTLDALVFQPFIGLGVGVYHNDEIIESGASPVNLRLEGQTFDSAFTRLGVHLAALDFLGAVDIGLDAAWQCRLTSRRYHLEENFTEFGTSFPIIGLVKDFSTFDGTLYLSTHLAGWDLYLEASGKVGDRVSSATYIAGLAFNW